MTADQNIPRSVELLQRASSAVMPNFDFRVSFCAATCIGVGRALNEDVVACDPTAGVFVMADGMGGHAAGEVAAQIAVDAACSHMRTKQARRVIARYADDPEIEQRRRVYRLLSDSVVAANEAVLADAAMNDERRGMGATLDLALLVRDRVFFAHVGDARCYLVRPTATLQLTHDHAAFDSLRSSGKRTSSLASSRSPLSNCLGSKRGLVVDSLFVDITTRDRVVLCTDGVFNAIDNEARFATLCRRGTAEQVCRTLVDAAYREGGADDSSAIVITVGNRFVQRPSDAGPRARDMETVNASPLLSGLEPSQVLATLAACVEVDIAEGDEIPCAVASDRVAYIVLDGVVELPSGRRLGASAMLMAQSLLDVPLRGKLPVVVERARLLRIRHDDFSEVCSHNTGLAAQLYERIASHLARSSGD